MITADVNSDVCQLGAEEERILASFTQRLIEIAAVAGARGTGASATDALNAMCLPAISIDRRGFIVDVNAAADAIFDNDVKIKAKRLYVRDLKARALLKAALDEVPKPTKLKALIAQPIIVQRPDKLPVILRIWPIKGAAHLAEQDVHVLVTLNALGPKPGQPTAVLAKTFHLTPSKAKRACIIARCAPPKLPPEK
jgi:hypothetical protein